MLALRDILDGEHMPRWCAGLVHGGRVDAYPNDGAVTPQQAHFGAEGLARLRCPVPLGEHPHTVLGGQGAAPVDAPRLSRGFANDALVSRIGIHAGALQVRDEDSQRRGVAHGPEARFAAAQGVPRGLALDQVIQGAGEPVGIQVPLDQIVLGTLRQSGLGQILALRGDEHQHQGTRGRAAQAGQQRQAHTVAQVQVKEDHVCRRGGEAQQGITRTAHQIDAKGPLHGVCQHLLDVLCLRRIVLDEQDPDR